MRLDKVIVEVDFSAASLAAEAERGRPVRPPEQLQAAHVAGLHP